MNVYSLCQNALEGIIKISANTMSVEVAPELRIIFNACTECTMTQQPQLDAQQKAILLDFLAFNSEGCAGRTFIGAGYASVADIEVMKPAKLDGWNERAVTGIDGPRDTRADLRDQGVGCAAGYNQVGSTRSRFHIPVFIQPQVLDAGQRSEFPRIPWYVIPPGCCSPHQVAVM